MKRANIKATIAIMVAGIAQKSRGWPSVIKTFVCMFPGGQISVMDLHRLKNSC